MKKNILENHDFTLGIQEEWDTYYEVTINFGEEVILQGFTYHLFKDKENKESYFLRPRTIGHQIEGVFVEKQISVNIAKKGLDAIQTENVAPVFYATGILKLLENA